ncbi:MAG: insulinase family protein [Treponema sp.]|nr:insulinase family protein [Treponema sp.]
MKKRIFVELLFLCALVHFTFAQATPIEGLFRYRLDNGLELFVMENDSAPLAYIEIAIRGGAVTQTKENCGLFHLYEHMMFKGNEKYRNQKACTEALNKMGVSDWNGTTGIDRVNYFFTVPSSLVYDGLEYWSYAIRTPLMDRDEFEKEKNVVLAEISGGQSESGRIFAAGLFKTLFPESPWRLDSSGALSTIKNATIEQLRQIQKEYYVPQNTALFVGGDVKHDEVYSIVKKIYGSWENGPQAKGGPVKVSTPDKAPLKNDVKYVFADDRMGGNIIQFVYYLRGPDAETDAMDTYPADVWAYLLANPSGSFLQSLTADKDLMIPDADYAGGGYSTMRASGMINFSAAMLNQGSSAVQKGEKLLKMLKGPVLENMYKTGTGFENENILKVKQTLEDSRIYSMETAQKFLSSLSATWASSGADYFIEYDSNIQKVQKTDISKYLDKYIKDKMGVAVLFVSPSYFEENKNEFDKYGWKVLNKDNAFWWQ